MATFDGQAVLGVAVHVVHQTAPAAMMMSEYFGMAGVMALMGGTRGRSLQVNGVFIGPDIPTLNAYEAIWETFEDGQVHTLVDDRGRVFYNLIYAGTLQVSPDGPKPSGSGWLLPFSISFIGLT